MTTGKQKTAQGAGIGMVALTIIVSTDNLAAQVCVAVIAVVATVCNSLKK